MRSSWVRLYCQLARNQVRVPVQTTKTEIEKENPFQTLNACTLFRRCFNSRHPLSCLLICQMSMHICTLSINMHAQLYNDIYQRYIKQKAVWGVCSVSITLFCIKSIKVYKVFILCLYQTSFGQYSLRSRGRRDSRRYKHICNTLPSFIAEDL